jgi:uncharacterized protein (DUF2267 family)
MMDFNKYAQEGYTFINELARDLGKEDDKGSVTIVLRAVLQTVRDRITIPESFNLIAQLPYFLKAIYVDQWKYREQPLPIRTLEEFKEEVKMRQLQYGEQDFDWDMPTEEIIRNVFLTLRKYVSEGELEDIQANLPEVLKPLVEAKV